MSIESPGLHPRGTFPQADDNYNPAVQEMLAPHIVVFMCTSCDETIGWYANPHLERFYPSELIGGDCHDSACYGLLWSYGSFEGASGL